MRFSQLVPGHFLSVLSIPFYLVFEGLPDMKRANNFRIGHLFGFSIPKNGLKIKINKTHLTKKPKIKIIEIGQDKH